MKIGIITFHDGINHGAFLQAFCLQEVLKEYGEVKIINYKEKNHYRGEYQRFLFFKPYLSKKNLKKRLQNFSKILKFRKAHQKFNLTKFSHQVQDICEQERFDVIVLGSDEIWNFKNALVSFNVTYFGGGGVSAKKIFSYAPSFGAITPADTLPEPALEAINKLYCVSVRDHNSQKILQQYGISSTRVLDPTFLHEVSPQKSLTQENYVLVYLNTIDKNNVKGVKKFAASQSKKLIAVGYEKSWCDENVINIGPYEWVAFFQKADYIITNTFHGTIFSIKNKKKFAIVNPGKKSNKITSLLTELDLTFVMTDNSDHLETVFSNDYPYKEVFLKLEKQISLSKQFLEKCLIS